jgi:hypothetical protein
VGPGSSLRARSAVKELGYKVTEIRTYMNPDTTMFYPLTALGEILSAKPAQTWLVIRTEIVYNLVEITNKVQPCNRITLFHRSLKAQHISSRQVWVETGQFPLRVDYGRSPHAYVNQRLQIQLEVLMMSGMPLETCWAFNGRWNNKFYHKVASCWLFLLIHTTMRGSMNIKCM